MEAWCCRLFECKIGGESRRWSELHSRSLRPQGNRSCVSVRLAFLAVVLGVGGLPAVDSAPAVGYGWSASQSLVVDGSDVSYTNISSAAHDRNFASGYVAWTPDCTDVSACLGDRKPSYASGKIYGSAHYGSLHGYAVATAFNNGPDAGSPLLAVGPLVTTVSSHANVSAIYRDELLIRANSLPVGSPVAIRFVVVLDVYYSSERYGGGVGEQNGAGTDFEILGSDGTIVDSRQLNAPYVSGVYTNRQTAVITRSVSVGDQIPISQSLGVSSWVSASQVGAFASRKVDALNTASLRIEVLTPGAYFESVSGSKYLAVNPGNAALEITRTPAGLVDLSWPANSQILWMLPALGAAPVAPIGTQTNTVRGGVNYNVLNVNPTNSNGFFYLGSPGN